jgi:hypothetical protein
MQMEQAKMQMAQQTAQQDLQIRQQQMELTATSTADKQKLEEQKVTGQLQLDGMRIGAQIEESQAKQQFDQAHTGARLDLDVADTKTKNAMQAAQIMETARNLQKGNTPK